MAQWDLFHVCPILVSWLVTAWLVVAALRLRQRLARYRDRFQSGAKGVVMAADGAFSALAFHRVEQVGRAKKGEKPAASIVFKDVGYDSEVSGGKVALESEGEVTVRGGRRDDEVWVDLETRQQAAEPDPEKFEDAYVHARKTKGFARTVEARLREGDQVVVAGVRVDGVLQGADGQPLLVATPAAVAWCSKQVVQLTVLVVAAFLVSGLVMATSRPTLTDLPGSALFYGCGWALCFWIAAVGRREIRRSTPLPSAPLRGTWRRQARS